MSMGCKRISQKYKSNIDKIVNTQKQKNKEAIFFIYNDGSTSNIYTGEHDHISLSPQQESEITSSGQIVGSVHSHPSGFDPSTIDIITGVMTQQEDMCVATPVHDPSIESDYVLTCIELNDMNYAQKQRMVRAMRRSSVSVTNVGRQIRKQFNLQRFNIGGCRSHHIKVDGIEIPVTSRPSRFKFVIGSRSGVAGTLGDNDNDNDSM